MKCSSKTFIVLCELCIAFQFTYVIRNFCILNCLDIGFYVRYSVTQFAGFLELRSLNNEFVIQFSISGRKFHLQFHTCIVWYDRKMVTLESGIFFSAPISFVAIQRHCYSSKRWIKYYQVHKNKVILGFLLFSKTKTLICHE